MASIFISYYRDDVSAIAHLLSSTLEQRFGADSVFIDVIDIAGGARFVQEIDEALEVASVLLVIIGDRWRELRRRGGFDYVGHEISQALSRRILVLPVLVDGAPMATEADVSPEMRGMLDINAVRIGHGIEFDAGAQRVIAAIRTFMPLPAVLRVSRGAGLRMRLGRATVLIDGQNRGELASGRFAD